MNYDGSPCVCPGVAHCASVCEGLSEYKSLCLFVRLCRSDCVTKDQLSADRWPFRSIRLRLYGSTDECRAPSFACRDFRLPSSTLSGTSATIIPVITVSMLPSLKCLCSSATQILRHVHSTAIAVQIGKKSRRNATNAPFAIT